MTDLLTKEWVMKAVYGGGGCDGYRVSHKLSELDLKDCCLHTTHPCRVSHKINYYG